LHLFRPTFCLHNYTYSRQLWSSSSLQRSIKYDILLVVRKQLWYTIANIRNTQTEKQKWQALKFHIRTVHIAL
jgi:hypothetical protein